MSIRQFRVELGFLLAVGLFAAWRSVQATIFPRQNERILGEAEDLLGVGFIRNLPC
ncbi:hypothetical protein JOD24_003111 [Kroppenstedtia sanguinis]|uniref:hypothetical protein n=1 Tax=Kroppenstedtia sanguinis TaxID=1380684 RepID=UPI003D218238